MSKALTVINDCHTGVVRSAGTTPVTAWKLRQWVLQRFEELLESINTDLLILGDLFDAYNVPYMDLLIVYNVLKAWLGRGHRLYLVPGNHDLSKTTTTMSSFQFLCKLLAGDKNVVIMDQPGAFTAAGHACYVIPHLPNQDQLNLALEAVPKGIKYLFVHCNYDNKFAQQQDHSLNMSAEQARALDVERVIFAHEHQRKDAQAGKVVIIGNQIPTSVADCLGNDAKYMLRILPDAIEHLPVWKREGSFIDVDWRELKKVEPGVQFVRVSGEADALEATKVPGVISKLRSTHDAFVITNAVKVAGRDTQAEKISLEQIQGFDILKALLKRLTPAQGAAVTKLLEENNAAEA